MNLSFTEFYFYPTTSTSFTKKMPTDNDDESKSSGPLEGKALISAVGKFFYEDDAFAAVFEEFVNEKACVIDEEEIDKTGVMKVEYTEVYEEFQRLFEEKIESHISGALGSSVGEFYR